MIVAIIILDVFVGGANAGNCPRIKSAEATAVEVKDQSDKKAGVEA